MALKLTGSLADAALQSAGSGVACHGESYREAGPDLPQEGAPLGSTAYSRVLSPSEVEASYGRRGDVSHLPGRSTVDGLHASDCARHNGPAMAAGECGCGADDGLLDLPPGEAVDWSRMEDLSVAMMRARGLYTAKVLRVEIAGLRRELEAVPRLEKELEAAIGERDVAIAERDVSRSNFYKLSDERQKLRASMEAAVSERITAFAERDTVRRSFEEVRSALKSEAEKAMRLDSALAKVREALGNLWIRT